MPVERIKAKAAADMLGISARKVYQMADSGELPAYRIGRAVRFDPADVIARQPRAPVAPTGRVLRTLAKLQARAEEVAHVDLPWPEPVPRPAVEPPPPKPRKARDRALVAHHAAKRRASRLERMPPWVDLAAIRALHDEAQRLTCATGIQHHVDHEIPLQGKLVSGLHVHTNMQIITGVENSRKRNRFEVSSCS